MALAVYFVSDGVNVRSFAKILELSASVRQRFSQSVLLSPEAGLFGRLVAILEVDRVSVALFAGEAGPLDFRERSQFVQRLPQIGRCARVMSWVQTLVPKLGAIEAGLDDVE